MQNSELVFDVTRDEDGNYCACAETEEGALITDGKTMDEMLAMIQDIIALYNEDNGTPISSFSLHFNSATIIAA